jgi:SAM-dependent methyltransferase
MFRIALSAAWRLCVGDGHSHILSPVFPTRSNEPERIDTGDYTAEEYKTFLREIRFINRWIGDRRALRKTLLKTIAELDLSRFSVLDVGAGSGEMLKEIALFSRRRAKPAFLAGLDLNELSAESVAREGRLFTEINSVRGNALDLPFADGAFDFAICSLFTHHFTDEGVVEILKQMKRVARRGIFVIDLHRERGAYRLYKLFCFVFRISKLVRDDGLLSIKKGFQPDELRQLAIEAGIAHATAQTVAPARVVVTG